MTVPKEFYKKNQVRSVGIILAHGSEADEQRGQLLEALARYFASKGHIVMRYHCRQKEMRRQRIYERSVDVATFSPYALNSVSKWIYCGHMNGARIATTVGFKSSRPKAGFIFLSYPLLEPSPPPTKLKAGAKPPQDSLGPMHKLMKVCKAPQLYICGDMDHDCPASLLRKQGRLFIDAGIDARAVIIPGVDAQFRKQNDSNIDDTTLSQIETAIDNFLDAIENDTFTSLNIRTVANM